MVEPSPRSTLLIPSKNTAVTVTEPTNSNGATFALHAAERAIGITQIIYSPAVPNNVPSSVVVLVQPQETSQAVRLSCEESHSVLFLVLSYPIHRPRSGSIGGFYPSSTLAISKTIDLLAATLSTECLASPTAVSTHVSNTDRTSQ